MLSFIIKIKNMRSRDFFMLIILLLFITNIVRIMNIPGLKEILPLIYFTIVPGLIIVILLNLNKLEFIKKFVLWVGLSLCFIILLGLGLNSTYPIISKPLALFPLLITFDAMIIILSVIAYRRNKEEFDIQRIFNFSLDAKDKLVSPMLFSVIFPFLAFFGTYLMNTANNNSILLFMLFLVPIYFVFVVILGLRKKISNSTYPFAILMVSLSFLLIHGLTSYYLIGRDIHLEFFCFQYTLNNLHWDQLSYNIGLNSCLSVTILPAIYSVLTSIKGLYIFKIVFGFIGSILPLIIYIICKKYIKNRYALLATLLFIFQMNFIELSGIIRQEISFIFFFLAVLVLFDTDITKTTKKCLFVTLMLSVVISHYTTAFVGLFLTVPILLTPFFKGLLLEKKIKLTNFDVLIVLGGLSFLWYFLVSKAQSNMAIRALAKTSGSVTGGSAGIAVNTTKEDTVLSVAGVGLDSISQIISVIINDAIFLVIAIGVITVLLGYILRHNYYKNKIPFEFVLGSILSAFLLVLFVVIPYFSNAYGASRIFIQCLVFLAPMFVIGGIKIAKTIRKPKLDVVVLIILLISLFSVSFHFNYYFNGIPSSIYFDSNSNERMETYIYNQDIGGAEFLSRYGAKRLKIYSDASARSRLMAANNFSIDNIVFIENSKSFKLNRSITWKIPYLYLTYVNTQKNIIYEALAPPKYVVNSTHNYRFLNEWKSRIYDNGGSKVLIP